MFGSKEEGYTSLPTSHTESGGREDAASGKHDLPRLGRRARRLLLSGTLLLLLCAALASVRRTAKQCRPAWESESALLCHHNAAKAKFELLLRRQSRTAQQAAERYRSRYKRDPPPGYDGWVQFALRHGSPIIDDFDQIDADISPFRSIDPAVLKARIERAVQIGQIEIHSDMSQISRLSIKNKTASVQQKHPKLTENVRTTKELLEPIAQYLPDVDILVNWGDRNIIRGPTQELTEQNMQTAELVTFAGKDAWNALRAPCPRNTIAESPIAADRPTVNTCRLEESEVRFQHGVFNSFTTVINTTVPVVSLGKLSTFQDIAAPPWCYGSQNYRRKADDALVPFEQKKSQVYWRGSGTGLIPPTLDAPFDGHRQRILLWIEQLRNSITERRGGRPNSTTSRVENMPAHKLSPLQEQAIERLPDPLLDVGFIQYDACAPDEHLAQPDKCAQFATLFPMSPPRPTWNAVNFKYLLDIDGNAMSCRFYRLLEMGSVVFKQTIWAEWHDDRMVPFLHYVPLDIGADTLPLYVDLLENTESGRRIAKTIAESGRSWTETGLRKIDLSIAYYRMLLEMAHILG